jgi:hypothetical protein
MRCPGIVRPAGRKGQHQVGLVENSVEYITNPWLGSLPVQRYCAKSEGCTKNNNIARCDAMQSVIKHNSFGSGSSFTLKKEAALHLITLVSSCQTTKRPISKYNNFHYKCKCHTKDNFGPYFIQVPQISTYVSQYIFFLSTLLQNINISCSLYL